MNSNTAQNYSLPVPTTHEKYRFIRKNSPYFRLTMLAYMASVFILLYGYYLAYLDVGSAGIIAAVCLIVFSLFILLSGLVAMQFKGFNLRSHKRKIGSFWKRNPPMPTTDIFLPLCGEDIQTVKNTWDGVTQLIERHGSSVKVYVLDDKGLDSYKIMAKQFGFTYLSRPNKGEMKKAGNIKYGTDHSKGDFIVIFDADFRPHRDFLYDLLPYMNDSQVGIIQSPQYFDVNDEVHDRSRLEYGAGHIQEYFYRVVQHAQNTIGGTICVGSNALYRRAALESIGGTVQIEHSEDIWTGYTLVSKGWKVLYIPIILAKGVCPSDIHSYFKQQTRWCNGSLSLMATKAFWTAPVAIKTKVPYIAGFTFYISTLFILLLPLLNLYFLDATKNKTSGLYFIPFSLLSITLLYFYVFRKARVATFLAASIATWSYVYAIVSSLLGNMDGWQPSGGRHSVSQGYKNMTWIVSVYFAVYGVEALHYILHDTATFSIETVITYFWLFATLLLQWLVVHHLWQHILKDSPLTFSSLNPIRFAIIKR